MNIKSFTIILIGVLLNAGAQLFLKKGSSILNGLDSHTLTQKILMVISNYAILSGLVLYVFSVALWIVALSRVSVSIAYPMLSIGYVVNLFAASVLFNEPIGLNKIIGVLVIIIGVIILARSQ